jgi:4-amino-4-deoxy-L-arabinose transferase-like glycosyltransferase
VLALTALAAYLRGRDLGRIGFWIDESLSMQASSGRGWIWGRVPFGAWIEASPHANAIPADLLPWRVWTNVTDESMPGLYFQLLHLWRRAFGDADTAVRTLSVLLGTLAVPATYLAARCLRLPRPAALLATALITLAPAHVYLSRDARPYPLVSLLICLTIAAAARVARERLGDRAKGASSGRSASSETPDGRSLDEQLGLTPRRSFAAMLALAACVAAAAMAHYYAIPAACGIFVFALFVARGSARWRLLGGLALGGFAWVCLWGPWFWAQVTAGYSAGAQHLMFDAEPGHTLNTLTRLLGTPSRLLSNPYQPSVWLDAAIVVGLLGGGVLAARRNRLLWLPVAVFVAAWLTPAAYDLAKHTFSLKLIRYSTPAIPGLVLVAASVAWAAARGRRWAGVAIGVALVGFTLAGLPSAYEQRWGDWRALVAAIRADARPGENVIIVGRYGGQRWYYPEEILGHVAHYLPAGRKVGLVRADRAALDFAHLAPDVSAGFWLILSGDLPAAIADGYEPDPARPGSVEFDMGAARFYRAKANRR